MSSLRSLGCLATRYGARQAVRPALTTNVRTSIIMRRTYATAPPPPPSTGNTGSNPLLWIGNYLVITFISNLLTVNLLFRLYFSRCCIYLLSKKES
jgi:hypothetical protein